MLDHLEKKPTKKEDEAALQKKLDKEVKVPLQVRDVILIHNIISGLSYKLGDAEIIVHKILPKLLPFAAVDTNIPEKKEPDLVLGD